MRVLDLFAGLGGWSAPFRARGHDVFTVDLDERLDVDLHADILELHPTDLPWKPDIILASPPCETFSVMSIGTHWGGGHRAYEPKTEAARKGMQLVEQTRWLVDVLDPRYFIIENPRGVLRKLGFMADLERRTVWYCRYGTPYAKPTDLWGGFPASLMLLPGCHNGHADHVRAPRGSRTGTQSDMTPAERAKVPYALGLQVCYATEKDLAAGRPMEKATLF